MTRIASILVAGSLVAAGLLAGCDSQATLIANPDTRGKISTIPATYTMSTSTILFPQAKLPEALKKANTVKILLGSTPMPMMATPAGLTTVVPQTAPLTPNKAGKQRFLFILDNTESRVYEAQITTVLTP